MFSITRTAKFLVPATASVALHKIYISKGKLEFTVLHEVRARLVQGINEGSLRNKYIEWELLVIKDLLNCRETLEMLCYTDEEGTT